MSVYITREMIHSAADDYHRSGALSVWGKVKRLVAGRRERRRAIAELQSMDDYLLRDIGVSRSDIPRVVMQGDYRRAMRAAPAQMPRTRLAPPPAATGRTMARA